MEHDGGYVRGSMPFPGREGIVAVRGTWSGGAWEKRDFYVTQHRGQQHTIGIWRVVGVDVTSKSSRSPVLLMTPASASAKKLDPGDVVTFGDEVTAFSSFDVPGTTLPAKEDASILFGSSKIHGVVCVDNYKVSRVILFHGTEDVLPISQTHSVWWNSRQYGIKLKQDAVTEVELHFPGTVKLSRLLNTLTPILRFTTNSGHEMMGDPPRKKRGTIRDDVRSMFEPTVRVAAGSVRIILSQATPTEMNLYVKSHEPMTLLAASLVDTTRRDSHALLTALGERLFDVKPYLKILKEMSRSIGNEVLQVSVGVRPPVDITYGSSIWLSELIDIPESMYVRKGEFYAIDSHRYWCRVLFDDQEDGGDWTFRFKPSMLEKVKNLPLNTRVEVTFRTRVPEDAPSGSGNLITIEPTT